MRAYYTIVVSAAPQRAIYRHLCSSTGAAHQLRRQREFLISIPGIAEITPLSVRLHGERSRRSRPVTLIFMPRVYFSRSALQDIAGKHARVRLLWLAIADASLTAIRADNAGDTAGVDVGDASNGIPMAVIPGPTNFDIMTYCGQPQWLSDYTYERILSDPRGYGLEQQDPTGNGLARAARTFTVGGKFVSVIATINLSKRAGRFDFVQTVNRAALVTFHTPTQAALAYVTANGKVSAQYSANVQPNSETQPGEDVTALVDATIPYSATAGKLELLLDGKVLDQRTINKTLPVVRGVVSKTPGTLSWQTPAAEPGRLTFYVQGSRNGQSWETIASGLSKPILQLSAAERRRYVRLRVIANDGFHNSLPVEEHR
jgi:hypothetical protein